MPMFSPFTHLLKQGARKSPLKRAKKTGRYVNVAK
jgi:hypothetical protein